MSETHYYEYDAANQLTKIVKVEKPEGEDAVYTGCAYFTYDENGNTTAWARHDEAHALIEASYYTWDDENQLLAVQRLVGGTTYAFTYDGDHRRASWTLGGSANYYHWDGLNVMLERDESGTTLRTHTHGAPPPHHPRPVLRSPAPALALRE